MDGMDLEVNMSFFRRPDFGEQDSARPALSSRRLRAGESYSDSCECLHLRGLHPGLSRCVTIGCECAKFRLEAPDWRAQTI